MGRAIVKVGIGFCEWSSVVDAPVSEIVTREEALAAWDRNRVLRADTKGHSYLDQKPDMESWKFNRAGPNEECIQLKRMYHIYGSDKLKAQLAESPS